MSDQMGPNTDEMSGINNLDTMEVAKLADEVKAGDDAINKLTKSPFDQVEIDKEFNFVCKKLDISEEQLKNIMIENNKSFKNYKSSYYLIQFFVKLLRAVGVETRLIR